MDYFAVDGWPSNALHTVTPGAAADTTRFLRKTKNNRYRSGEPLEFFIFTSKFNHATIPLCHLGSF